MKKIFSILICGIMVFGLVGCGSTSTTKEEPIETAKEEVAKEEVTKKEPIEALKEEFKNKGFTIGKNSTIAYDMMGATSGQKFKLNDGLIEIYYYDESKLTEEGKKLFEQAKNGSVNVSGFNVPVVYKNNFVIARVNEHKYKDKILEIFNSFKY